MKKLLFIVFALFLQTGSFGQDNLVWNCDRDSQQPDILGSSNDTHAQGWVAWPLTSDEFTGPLLNQAKCQPITSYWAPTSFH